MNLRTRVIGVLRLALALMPVGATLTMAVPAAVSPPRQPGPCDIYGAAGTPCVAAHSTTRALYASYKGALYRVTRQSDGKPLDIGLDAGGYADAAAQDAFCAKTICTMTLIYDQSGKGNHLYQAAPGTFKGPAKGGFDTQPIADMAQITIAGHKAYGVYIMPGMGFRNNNASGIAINDEPEGIYYVIDGTHYDSGCCFDYGNSSTNGRAVGTGTMETTYFGTATAWGSGNGRGPWIMSDMEARPVFRIQREAKCGRPDHRFVALRYGCSRWRRGQQVGSPGRQCAEGRSDDLLQRNSPRLADQRQLLSDAQAGRHTPGHRRR